MKNKGAFLSLLAILTITTASCDKANETSSSVNPSDTSSSEQKKVYDNEVDSLVLSTQALDGLFNPFFYTSGYDGEIVGQTQISMLGTNNAGEVKVGENEPTVVLEYTETTTDTRTDKTVEDDYENYYTTYRFLIKNGIQFSDGTELTIKDVLYNMYVYLDPVYTGSTTMYSTNIKGYKAYRSQTEDEGEQNAFDTKFETEAEKRILNIVYWCDDKTSTVDSQSEQVKEDIALAKKLFMEELETDWNNAEASITDYEDTYQFTDAWQVFLYNYNYISVKTQADSVWDGVNSETPEALEWNGWDKRGPNMTKEQLINAVYMDKVENDVLSALKTNLKSIVRYYATASKLKSELIAQAKSDYFKQQAANGKNLIENISGITTEKVTSFTKSDGSTMNLSEPMDVLQIVINGVDPKAIWNFGFTVAPMHYYSKDYADLFNGVDHFGLPFGDKDYMDQMQQIQIPMGAGPYRAADAQGNTPTEKGRFFDSNVVNFVRNDYFLLGKPKIRKLNYQVINSNQLFNSVATGAVAFADPNAKIETVNEVKSDRYKNKLGYQLVDNNGYGYIGINASYVHELKVRRAIMYAMDTSLVLNYYTNEMASTIDRPMTSISWAYPKGCTAYYPYIGGAIPSDLTVVDPDYADYVSELGKKAGEKFTQDEQKDFIRRMVESAGYVERNNLYSKVNSEGQTEKLEYTFTLAGESTDHPAYGTFKAASDLLNLCGFKITVKNDAQALSKLSAGTLTVWAAAWSSTIDPDMYQVYHKNSNATSINNWGYAYMQDHESVDGDTQLTIIDTLAELIEQGRSTTDQTERKNIYSQALDQVMQLAVELPTYQRKNLYVYDKTKIDETTLQQEVTPYNGPLSRIWEVSLVTK